MKRQRITGLVVSICFLLLHWAGHCFADGSIVACGWNESGQCNVPAPNTGFVAIAAGCYHSLGLKADGSIVVWGYNATGQYNVPAPNTGFVAIAGGSNSLGLKADGSIVAWGQNDGGQCNVPAPNSGFVAVAAGYTHSLGLKADGSIVAWGSNNAVPAPNTGFVAVAAGGLHSLGLKADGSIVAWGNNNSGQCNVPAPNTGFMAVAGGERHSLGLKADGSIVSWGGNQWGQCNVPEPNTGFVAIAGGERYHSLGLKADGSIVTWGNNYYGQCNVPALNTGFVAIAAGQLHNLGLQLHGSLQVTIEPAEAAAVGAQWRRVGIATWRNSGYIEDGIPTGDYTVEFKMIANWDTPSTQNVTIIKDQTTTTTGTYVRQTGILAVAIEPVETVADGAQWSVDGGTTWYDSGTSLTLPTGDYTVTFKGITHWVKPAGIAVTLTKDQLLERTGTYTAAGALQVTIEPAAAVASGAQWSVDGEATWHPSGATLVLAIGPRTVRFKAVAGRVTPADQLVTIEHRQTSEIAVYYNAPPVSQLFINPTQPCTLDTIQAIVTANDADGHAIVEYQYQWLRDADLVTSGPMLAHEYTAKGQQWQLRARACDSVGDWGEWATLPFTIANTPPTQPVVEIRPQTPTPDRDLIVDVIEYSQDPDGDAIGYDFQWFLSRNQGQTWIHKAELDGSSQVSNEYILEGDLWRVKVTPYEIPPMPSGAMAVGQEKPGEIGLMSRVEGTPGWYQVYVGQNSLPQLQFTQLAGARDRDGNVRLQIAWTWYDDDNETCTVMLFWTDCGSYGLHAISETLPAEQGGHDAVVAIAAGVPVHVRAVITDFKGAMTQVTSAPILIDEYQAPVNYWLFY